MFTYESHNILQSLDQLFIYVIVFMLLLCVCVGGGGLFEDNCARLRGFMMYRGSSTIN